MQKLSTNTMHNIATTIGKGSYRLSGRFLKGSQIKGAKDVDQKWEVEHPILVVRRLSSPGHAAERFLLYSDREPVLDRPHRLSDPEAYGTTEEAR